MVLYSLDGNFRLFVLLHYRLLLMLLLSTSGRLLLRAIVALQLSDVLCRVWVGTIVSQHLDRLLSFIITDQLAARVVHRKDLRVVIFDFLDDFGHVGRLTDYLLCTMLLLIACSSWSTFLLLPTCTSWMTNQDIQGKGSLMDGEFSSFSTPTSQS